MDIPPTHPSRIASIGIPKYMSIFFIIPYKLYKWRPRQLRRDSPERRERVVNAHSGEAVPLFTAEVSALQPRHRATQQIVMGGVKGVEPKYSDALPRHPHGVRDSIPMPYQLGYTPKTLRGRGTEAEQEYDYCCQHDKANDTLH